MLFLAATNIFIHGNEEQGQLVNEMRFLWEQNQVLKEQLNMGSRGKFGFYLISTIPSLVSDFPLQTVLVVLDKQKENEKLREALARRTAKLEQSRKECEDLRQENVRLKETLEHSSHENSLLQNSLRSSREELQRYKQTQSSSSSCNILQSASTQHSLVQL